MNRDTRIKECKCVLQRRIHLPRQSSICLAYSNRGQHRDCSQTFYSVECISGHVWIQWPNVVISCGGQIWCHQKFKPSSWFSFTDLDDIQSQNIDFAIRSSRIRGIASCIPSCDWQISVHEFTKCFSVNFHSLVQSLDKIIELTHRSFQSDRICVERGDFS